MNAVKVWELQLQLASSWKLAYNLEKETENPEIKAMFAEINYAINSLEVKLYDISDRATK